MRRLTLMLFATVSMTALSGGMNGLQAADGHSHDSHGTQHALTLDHGSKWATDDALRQGMAGIRTLVDAHHRQGGGDYAELADGIRSHIDQVIANCRLTPKADAALHVVLGEMFDGVALLEGEKGEGARAQGVERLAHALDQYGQYFDHPDWADPHAAH